MEVSVFRKVAIGIAANNKALEGNEIEVESIEWFSFRDGELTDNPEELKFKTTDATGNSIAGRIAGNMTIKATWIPNGSNRVTAPHVRRGTRVYVYQSADEDKFYWSDIGLDDHLKKLETIIVAISAHTEEQESGKPTALTPENTYWFEFSSHSKKLAFSSAKANGEPYKYEMYFDFAEGEFMVKDDIGNFINVVSKENLIHLQNADQCFIKLSRKNMDINVPQDLTALIGRDAKINVGNNLTATIGVTANIKAGLSLVLDGGGSTQTHTAAGIVVKAPTWKGGPT